MDYSLSIDIQILVRNVEIQFQGKYNWARDTTPNGAKISLWNQHS